MSEATALLVTGSVAAVALHKPSDATVTRVSEQGGSVGRKFGEFVTASMEALLPLLARRAGAHQCDACGKQNLYNYYKNTKAGSAPGAANATAPPAAATAALAGVVGPSTVADVDLCVQCYPRWVKKDPEVYNDKTKKLEFKLHDNSMFILKYVPTSPRPQVSLVK